MSIKADKIVGTYDIYSKQYVSTFTEKPALINVTDCAFELSVEATFECSYTGLSIADGTTGDTVSATLTKGTVDSISPTTYQSGSNTYTVGILAPDGYLNAGSIIDCTTTATGINPPPPPTPPPPTGPTPPPTPTPCTDCGVTVNPIGNQSIAVGGNSGTVSLSGSNVDNWLPFSFDTSLVTVSLSGTTLTYTSNSNNNCGNVIVRAIGSNSNKSCCEAASDFIVSVTGCTGPTPPPTPPTPTPPVPTPPTPTPPVPTPPTPTPPAPTPPVVNCYIYDIAADGGEDVMFTWTTCNGGFGEATVLNGDAIQTSCAQEGTVSMSPNSGTITLSSSC